MTPILLLALLAAQSASGPGDGLQPASEAAILAGGKACIGATVDSVGQAARLAGWTDATTAQKAKMTSDGRVMTRDNVLLIVKPGIDGGCVIQAKTAPTFNKASFLTALGVAAGTPIIADPKAPVTNLPNGELLVTQVDSGFVQLVVGNPHGKYVKNRHSQASQGK